MRYHWEHLASGVWRCRLAFLDVTVGLVSGPGGALLVDCGTTLTEAANIGSDVRGLTGAEVTHLVMTHHHFDHILGSGGFPEARSYAAPAVGDALTGRVAAVAEHARHYGADPAELARAVRAARRPANLVERATIDLGGRIVAVEHPGRGHTDHDLVVVVPPAGPPDRTVVFCGDLVEESADPAVDDGSDLAAWPTTLDRLLALGGDDAIYVPGHGAVVDAAFVRAQRDWLARR
ncbi:MAG: MBL fold metallo-hydrolase [Mycobacterium sp.]